VELISPPGFLISLGICLTPNITNRRDILERFSPEGIRDLIALQVESFLFFLRPDFSLFRSALFRGLRFYLFLILFSRFLIPY